MNQKTKPNEENAENREEPASKNSEKDVNEKRSYYDDDAHGYEIYIPDEDDENEDQSVSG